MDYAVKAQYNPSTGNLELKLPQSGLEGADVGLYAVTMSGSQPVASTSSKTFTFTSNSSRNTMNSSMDYYNSFMFMSEAGSGLEPLAGDKVFYYNVSFERQGVAQYYKDGDVVKKRYFLMAVNIGLGAEAIEISDECKHYWGKRNPTYIVSLFRLFLRRKLYRMHLKVNDEVLNERLMTVCVGNSRGYGLTPSAVPYNGWLDVSVVYRPELWQMVQGLWMLLRGHILNHKQVKPYRTKKVSIYSAEGAAICVDGRTLEYTCPLEISLMPEFLNFIVPN
jgi:hypothetical protein